jgi:alkylation response protein AidB-like acyl-CoA dehydrogenase
MAAYGAGPSPASSTTRTAARGPAAACAALAAARREAMTSRRMTFPVAVCGGSDEQRERWLRPLLDGSVYSCGRRMGR